MFSADHLRFFLEVSRHGRLNDASRVLGVDHTTVGRRITSLEKAAGHRLFDRTPAGWQLTEAGRRLVGYAETVESTLIAAFEDQTTSVGSLTGSVRIAAPDGFGAFVLTPQLTRLRRDHPRLDVELVTATEHDALSTRGFDVAVSLERPSPRFMSSRKLASYELRLYASPSYLRAAPALESLDDLRRHVLIWYVDALLDVVPLRILDAMHLDGRPQFQTNNITGHWLAARHGLGIAPLPNYIGEPDDQLVCVLPDEFAVRRDYWTAMPRDLTRLARVKAVDELLRSIVADDVHLLAPDADDQ
ncbi:LysR family transcriptional regulator [Rhodococcus sp. BP-349]|uniref:LysR family transcriptional regulator n=1 Tax=unclassified Rhodococcus (in: high G+C Gram-positive bacteria) TaxID=192944 RepID=UPI001C9B1553|nr:MULTISPECIES: LysR family transcriptional regulator [unclassified Rhodococcus (in: high G+C Gram-positive bacteria)]MBY6540651.1 LysR family transcriptional regulator [Rhodococcus sp. BP-363]MBY6545324.1 LysR family transcriptional regulator [Rhodococcus sp. BP-369]MBY6564554.1 LysR family transcriptional regulator [Rhodococcus sp. BP-370]MBY6578510.1 LysR family transcriptional regulator [Rhodococcus sp. BP-364]MBY6587811.1 LysR family transcriptional regulator [Rhodococcus sp. BP-358]